MPKNPLRALTELFRPVEEKLPKGTFSPLARAIDAAPQERATGDQWANYFVNRDVLVGGQRFPVRPEELRMTGIGSHLLSVPSETISRQDLMARLRDAADSSYPRRQAFKPERGETQYDSYVSPGPMTKYREKLTYLPNHTYEAPHFDEPHSQGLISHSRSSVRDLPGGRSVHVDEIQSDLHQAARDAGGYFEGSRADAERRASQLRRIFNEAERNAYESNRNAYEQQPRLDLGLITLNHPLHPEYLNLSDLMERPDWAPYSKTYHEQEFNKALRQAANQDIPNVTWTTGRQQANRWGDDLGDFRNLRYDPEARRLITGPNLADERFQVNINPTTGRPEAVVPREGHRSFGSMFGNDIANRLMKGETIPEGWIGGGGFRDFYDNAIRKYAQSFERRFPGDVQYGMQQFQDVKPQAPVLNYQLMLDDLRGMGAIVPGARFAPEFRPMVERYFAGDRDPALLRDAINLNFQGPGALNPNMLARVIDDQRSLQEATQNRSSGGLYDQVHGITLGPQARAWIKKHGLPIATASPLAVMATQDQE